MELVGCDCGYEDWWMAQPKAVAVIWPKGYPDYGGAIRATYLATDTDDEIRQKFVEGLHESIRGTARLERIERLRPPVEPVSSEYARYMTMGDNT